MEAPLSVGAGGYKYVSLYSKVQKALESEFGNKGDLEEFKTYFEQNKSQDEELQKYKTFDDFVDHVRRSQEQLGLDEEESACDCC